MYAYLQCVEKLLEAKADIDMKNNVSGGGGGVLIAVSEWRSEGQGEREAMPYGVRLVVGEQCVCEASCMDGGRASVLSCCCSACTEWMDGPDAGSPVRPWRGVALHRCSSDMRGRERCSR